MNDNPEQERMLQYMELLDRGQRIAFYPEIEGVGHNDFRYLDRNRTYFTLKNAMTGDRCYVPFAAIEFVAPGRDGTIIRLCRQMRLEQDTLL